jgi:hypothetical protein
MISGAMTLLILTVNKMVLSAMTLSMMTPSVTKKCDIQLNGTQHSYAECHLC